MAGQYIKQGNIFGRVGGELGKGLAEQAPKEMEHYRLRTGLKSLADQADQGNLTPAQFLAEAAGTYGATPQMVQSFGELARQQGIAQGFKKVGNQQPQGQQQNQENPLRNAIENNIAPQENKPGLQKQSKGLVSSENTGSALKPYIPKNRDQLLDRAGDLYEKNRQLYPNPEMAYTAAVQEDQQNQAISNANQSARQSQIGVEDRLRKQLSDLRTEANVQIPDNVFQQVENDVIEKVAEGKGELEAAKEGQKKMDEISRQYKEFDTIGNWTFPFKDPRSTKRSIESLRTDFKKRDDLENFADSLVGRNGLSYPKAYLEAYPVNEYPEVNSALKSLPVLKGGISVERGYSQSIKNEQETMRATKQLARLVKDTGASPLAVAEELRRKNYDPDTFLDYMSKNKERLDLSERQGRELNKTRNWFPSLNDLWFFIGSGKDNVVEE